MRSKQVTVELNEMNMVLLEGMRRGYHEIMEVEEDRWKESEIAMAVAESNKVYDKIKKAWEEAKWTDG